MKQQTKNVLLGLGMFLFLCIVLGFWVTRPSYIDVELDLPTAVLPHGNWLLVKHTIQTWIYNDRYAVVQKQGRVLSKDYPSWSVLLDYFDRRLLEQGWQRASPSTLCQNWMPESGLIPLDSGNVFVYFPGNHERQSGQFLCLLIWSENPYSNDGKLFSYQVSLMIVNPMLLTRFRHAID